MRFENGALATVATGIYATGGNAFDSKVVFSSRDKRGEMHLISDFKVYGEVQKKQEEGGFVIADDGGVSAASGDAVVYKEEGDCGFACDRTFLEAVISGDGSKIRSPYSDALKSLAFAMACNASMETGMPVKVADMFLK